MQFLESTTPSLNPAIALTSSPGAVAQNPRVASAEPPPRGFGDGGRYPATVVFAGLPSGTAGVMQVNFTIPATAASGVQAVVISVGGVASPVQNRSILM